MRYRIAIGYDTAGFFYISSTNVPGLKARAKHATDVVEKATVAARRLLSRPTAKIQVEPGVMVRNSSF